MSVARDQCCRGGPFLRVSPPSPNNWPADRDDRASQRDNADNGDRIQKPGCVPSVRNEAGIAEIEEEPERSVNRLRKRKFVFECPLIGEPKTKRAISQCEEKASGESKHPAFHGRHIAANAKTSAVNKQEKEIRQG